MPTADKPKKGPGEGISAADVYERVAANVNRNVESDRAMAIDRVWKELKKEGVEDEDEATRLCEDMVNCIGEAPLVVNFKAQYFYNALLGPDRDYANQFQMWDRGVEHGKGRNYNELRNDVEIALFDLMSGPGVYDDEEMGKIGNKLKKKSVITVPKKDEYTFEPEQPGQPGKPARPTVNRKFKSTLRPRYAMANYARTSNGPSSWGGSYFELKDELKTRATYIAQDSFAALLRKKEKGDQKALWNNWVWKTGDDVPSAKDRLGTKKNLYRVVLYMPDNLFSAVRDSARGKVTPDKPYEVIEVKYGLGEFDYIEAHYHGEVSLLNSVKKIFVSMQEVQNRTEDYHANRLRAIAWGTCRQMLPGVQVVFLP
jgi:hypothetical protein